MKIKPLLSLSLITIFGFFSVVVNEKPSFSKETPEFKCVKVYEADQRSKIPTTVIWIPEEKKNVPLIYWKSQSFAESSPEALCEETSQKFDKAFREGRLNYITTGKVGNYNVICAIAKEEETCNGENELFTIEPYQNPEIVLDQIVGNFYNGCWLGVSNIRESKIYIKIDLEKVAQQQGVEIEK